MPSSEPLVSHCSGELAPSAFHAQLRRLESLQTLMAQGGTVVGEVAQFLATARAELGALREEQERYASAQEQLLEEKRVLAERLSGSERKVEESAVRVKELELALARETAESQARQTGPSAEQLRVAEEERAAQAEKLSAATDRITHLESALARERAFRETSVDRTREEQAEMYARELALLKERLTSLENQLEAERQRRARLMEVVKTHDVTVSPLPRESAGT